MSTNHIPRNPVNVIADAAGVCVLQCAKPDALPLFAGESIHAGELLTQPVVIRRANKHGRTIRLTKNKIIGLRVRRSNGFESFDNRRPERRTLSDVCLESLAVDARNAIDSADVTPAKLAAIDGVHAAVQRQHDARPQNTSAFLVSDDGSHFVVCKLSLATPLDHFGAMGANNVTACQFELPAVRRMRLKDRRFDGPVEHAANGQDASVEGEHSQPILPNLANIGEVLGAKFADFSGFACVHQELNDGAVVVRSGAALHPACGNFPRLVLIEHGRECVKTDGPIGIRAGVAVAPFDDGLQHLDRLVVIGAKIVIMAGDSLAVLTARVSMDGKFEASDHDSKGVQSQVVSTCVPPTCTYNLSMFPSQNRKPPPGVEPGTTGLQNHSSALDNNPPYENAANSATLSPDANALTFKKGNTGVRFQIGAINVDAGYAWAVEKFVSKTYFIYCRESNAVKIGHAKAFLSRFSHIQLASPFDLVPVAIRHGNHEKTIHRAYAKDRIRGEWFKVTPQLASSILKSNPEPLYELFPLKTKTEAEAINELGDYASLEEYARARYLASYGVRTSKLRTRVREGMESAFRYFRQLALPPTEATK